MARTESWNALQVGYFCDEPTDQSYSPGRCAKAEQLNRLLVASGASVETLSTWSPSRTEVKEISIIRALLNRLAKGLSLSKKIRQRSTQVQLLALYNCYFTDLLAVAWALWGPGPRIPLLIQLEDVYGARKVNSGWKLPFEKLSAILLLSRAALVFTPTQGLWDTLSAHQRSNLCRHVLFPPTLSQQFLEAVAARQEPFKGNRWILVYAGGFGPDKGTDDLLAAFTKASHPKLELHLYGGPYPEVVKTMKNVFVHGIVSPNELAMAYARADACINPHRQIRNPNKIFPCKNIEILASGALPLFSDNCHVKQLGVPDSLVFSCQQELLIMLKSVEIVYVANKPNIKRLSRKVRQDYDEEKVASCLAREIRCILN